MRTCEYVSLLPKILEVTKERTIHCKSDQLILKSNVNVYHWCVMEPVCKNCLRIINAGSYELVSNDNFTELSKIALAYNTGSLIWSLFNNWDDDLAVDFVLVPSLTVSIEKHTIQV